MGKTNQNINLKLEAVSKVAFFVQSPNLSLSSPPAKRGGNTLKAWTLNEESNFLYF